MQTIAGLKRKLKRRGITQQRVAERAGVTKQMVCHVLAERAVSAKVVGAARELLGARE